MDGATYKPYSTQQMNLSTSVKPPLPGVLGITLGELSTNLVFTQKRTLQKQKKQGFPYLPTRN